MFPRQEMPEWTNDVLPFITSTRPMVNEIFEEVPYDTELYEFSRIAYGVINTPLFEPTCNLTCGALFEPTCNLTCGGIVNSELFEQTAYDTDLYENSHSECGVFPSITDELLIITISNANTEIHSTVILHEDADTYVASKPITHLTLRVANTKKEIIVMYNGVEYHNYTMSNNGSYIQFVFNEPITPAIFMDI